MLVQCSKGVSLRSTHVGTDLVVCCVAVTDQQAGANATTYPSVPEGHSLHLSGDATTVNFVDFGSDE